MSGQSDPLREALREIAERGPTVTPSASTWQRARQARRVRQLIGSSLALVLVLAGLSVLWMHGGLEPGGRQVTQPASYGDSDLLLPDQVWTPSPWIKGTAELGSPGPLAVVNVATERRTSWNQTESSWFGVSAVTGEYRYVDLPDMAPLAGSFAVPLALSPDGTRLAYWLRGGPAPGESRARIVGWASYDTTTGDVARHTLDLPGGLAPEQLIWSPDSQILLVSAGERDIDHPNSATAWPVALWNAADDEVRQISTPPGRPHAFGFAHFGRGPGGFVTRVGRTMVTVAPGDGSITTERVRGELDQHLMVSPDGRLAAALDSSGQRSGGVLVSRLQPSGSASASVTRVGGIRYPEEVVGWVDDSTLIVLGSPTSPVPGGSGGFDLLAVDADTGTSRSFITLNTETGSPSTLQVATDYLDRPLRAGVKPPSPWDPRVVTGIVAVVVLAVCAVVGRVVVGRRRERRATFALAGMAR